MNEENDITKEIKQRAERLLHYNNLLIEQCDNWLSAEEGNRIMEMRIMERKKKASPQKNNEQ